MVEQCAGQMLVADEQDACILKLVGDVRVNLCKTFGEFIKSVDCDGRKHVIVDLAEATNLDSTTLGLLAKLALYCRDKLSFELQIFCPTDDVLQLLKTMGIQHIAHIEHRVCPNCEGYQALHELQIEETDAHEQVLDAHRILMSLNEQNRDRFKDLVEHLQSGCP